MRGATFKLKGTPEDNFHFWIIVGYEKHGRVLAINVTDEKWSPDSPCKISVGDHPVITKPSVAFYKKAREFSLEAVKTELASQIAFVRFPDASPALLKRIEDGAREADDFTARLVDYLDGPGPSC